MRKIVFFIFVCAISSFAQLHDDIQLKGYYFNQNPPGDTPELFADNILTKSCALHTSPVFNPELNEIYWSPLAKDGCDEKIDEILFMQLIDGVWTEPEVVPFSSTFFDSNDPFMSPDGKRLYFTTHRPTGFLSFDTDEKVMYVEKDEEGWTDPQSVGDEVNSMFRHWQISVSSNYNLYFRADKESVEEPGICPPGYQRCRPADRSAGCQRDPPFRRLLPNRRGTDQQRKGQPGHHETCAGDLRIGEYRETTGSGRLLIRRLRR